MKYIIAFLAIFTVSKFVGSHNATGQALTLTDTRFYGNNNGQVIAPTAAIQTRDKGIAFVGWSNNTGGGIIQGCLPATGNHGIIGKLDSNGNLLWLRANCSQGDYAKSICETPDGGFATNGVFYNPAGGMSLIRYDSAGNFLWEKRYGGGARCRSQHVINTADHGFMLLGVTKGRDSDITFTYVWPMVAFPPNDWVLMKLDSLGNKQWVKTFGTSGDEYSAAELITDGKNYYVVGETSTLDHECADTVNHPGPGQALYTMKFDSVGNFLWSKAHGAGTVQMAMFDDRDHSMLVCGKVGGHVSEFTGSFGGFDMYVLKLDTSGNMIWGRQYGDNNDDDAFGLCKGPGSSYLLTGTSYRLNLPAPYTSETDFWLYYVDSNGTVIDHKRFGGYAYDGSNNVFPYKNDFVVLGASNSVQFLEGTGTNYNGGNVFLSHFKVAPLGVTPSLGAQRSFTISPNPAHNQFELKWVGNHAAGKVSCINAGGAIVYKSVVAAGTSASSISTATWPPGSYVVCWDAADRPRECQTILIH